MKRKNNFYLLRFTHLLALALIGSGNGFAQTDNQKILDGNQKYEKNDFEGAEKDYQDGLKENSLNPAGIFNLGDAYYQEQKYDEAAKQFEAVAGSTKNPVVRAEAYHNMGNALVQKKDYEKSIDAYKNALKANPDDENTKYNLAYAQAMMKKQQNQQDKNQQDKNKDKNDQQKKDNKDDQNKQDKKNDQQKQQNQNDQENKNNKDKQPQPQNKQYSKDELDRILQALNNEDKQVQDKVNKQKMQTVKGKEEKDW